MQKSSIMLDSTIAEMLSAKQVEPSMQVDSEKALTKDDSLSSNSSEAEVRLVVRFIVEEHHVYKGKIVKMQQIESEELTRIVSRVAWDGATDDNNSNTDRDNDVRVENTPNVESADLEQQNLSTQSNITSDSTTDTNTATSNAPMIDYNPTEEKSVDQVQEKTTRNIDSSNLEAYINSNSDSEKDIQKVEENSLAQEEGKTQIIESETATNCDNSLKRSSNHDCETDKQLSPKSPPNKPNSTPVVTENFDVDIVFNDDLDYGLNSNPTPESLDDACIESQSIADTLNDCVNNIDRECQQHRHTDESSEIVCALQSNGSDSPHNNISELQSSERSDQHNDKSDSKENGDDTRKPGVIIIETTNSNENNQDQDQKLYPDLLEEECSHEEIVRSIDPPCDIDVFNPTSDILPKEDASSSSIKRKATGENSSSGKRIRRANPKERNLNTRTSASKSSENSSAKHHSSSTPRHVSTGSLVPNNQQVRKTKVFAKWSDNHFYPGTILRPTKDRKLVIGFYDGAQRNVPETDLIPLGNIEGQQVRVSIAKNYCVNAIVHGQRSPVNDQPMFDVEYQQDGLVKKCVPLKDIFLTAEQGTPLINQVDKNSSAGNFADVDLDNIIYEKRSRRFQEMEEFYFTSSSPHRTKTSLLL